MLVSKCDICKRTIKGEPITAGFGYLRKTELCQKCGQPIIRFLKNKKLIKAANEKNK